jgi:hypothetical protein
MSCVHTLMYCLLATNFACASNQPKREHVDAQTDILTEAVFDQKLDKAREAWRRGLIRIICFVVPHRCSSGR